MSLLQRCGGILAHSSWQNCCNSATLEGFRAWTAFLRSCHSISIGFRSGLWLGHSKVFILFFFSHSEVDLLVCFGSEPKFASAWGHEQMAGHCPSGFFGRQQNSWFHLSQRVFQVLKQQNSPRPSHYHHHILLLVWCSFSEMLCYFYARCNGTHTFQKVQLLSRQSTEYFPKSLGDHQDVFWQNWDELLCSFCSAVVFVLELCHAGHVCPVSFLWWSHEHWP